MTKNFDKLTDQDIVRLDKAGIYIGNIFTVELNLDLPRKGKMGSTISWESKNKKIIQDDGKVDRPEYGMGNRTVTLIATISYGEASDTRVFEVTVLEKPRPNVIIGAKEVQILAVVGQSPKLPSVVITENDDGTFSTCRVVWNGIDCSQYAKAGVFSVEGTVDKTDIKAKATIKVVDTAVNPAEADSGKISSTPAVKPFDLSQVALHHSLFTENRDRDYTYLLSIDDDQMLYNFRTAAGLDTKGALPMDGWDAPDSNLRGHTTGHYMSALAMAYASSGNSEFKSKIDYLIAELAKCQDTMEASGKFSPGFLSGYSEEQFDKLEVLTRYPTIWAPYYTLHKIFAGLLDCYEFSGNTQALKIAEKLGYWVYRRLSRLDRDLLNKMWAMYIAGEYGGMNETMARLYGITGKQEFLAAAKYFDNDHLFLPMAENIDTLGGIHSNQHIPQIVGTLKTFEVSGEAYYYNISRNFWDMVTEHHSYNIGGNGAGEMFKPADHIAQYITDKTAETCSSYNMLKLTRGLFAYSPDARYMDFYERALYNHIAATQDKSGPNGGSTYFMPLHPGAQRHYDSDGNSCCHGTGMENHTKYQDAVYFHSEDGSTLYINLYIPSSLTWKERGFIITQTGDYLVDQAMSVTIEGNGHLDIRLRVPYWIRKAFTVKINGADQSIEAVPGSYITLSRDWTSGDRIDISMPFTFRFEPTPDDPNIVSIMYGPLVMSGLNDENSYLELDINEGELEKSIQSTEKPLTFIINGITLVPNYTIHDESYHAYFTIKKR